MKNFFHDISWAQIVAGALAAMTSFWLAAKIGVAGSIIGVAIGSIVSAVASQLYKNVLEASGQKLQETVIGGDEGDDTGGSTNMASKEETEVTSRIAQGNQTDSYSGQETRPIPQVGRETTVLHPVGGEADGETTVLRPTGSDIGSTSVMEPVPAGTGQLRTGRTVASSNGGKVPTATDRLDDAIQGDHVVNSSAEQIKRRKRNIVIVSVVSALVAVILSALAINLLTKGEGTDHVVRNVVSPPTTVQTPEESRPSETTHTHGNQSEPGQPSVTSQPSHEQTQAPQQSTAPTQQEPVPSPSSSTSHTPEVPETSPSPGDSPDSTATPTPQKTAQ